MSRVEKEAEDQRRFEEFENTVDGIMQRDDPADFPMTQKAYELAVQVSEGRAHSQQVRLAHLLLAERIATWQAVLMRVIARSSPTADMIGEMLEAGKSDKEIRTAVMWQAESAIREAIKTPSETSHEVLTVADVVMARMMDGLDSDDAMYVWAGGLRKEIAAALAQ